MSNDTLIQEAEDVLALKKLCNHLYGLDSRSGDAILIDRAAETIMACCKEIRRLNAQCSDLYKKLDASSEIPLLYPNYQGIKQAINSCTKDNRLTLEILEAIRPYAASPKRESSDVLELFRSHVKSIPIGRENQQRGASEYNWGQHYLAVLQDIIIKKQKNLNTFN